jgi:hypothetical protein
LTELKSSDDPGTKLQPSTDNQVVDPVNLGKARAVAGAWSGLRTPRLLSSAAGRTFRVAGQPPDWRGRGSAFLCMLAVKP